MRYSGAASILALAVAAAAVSSGYARECTSDLDNQLLLAESSKIWSLSPDGKSREIVASAPSALSLDYSYARNTLYWSDLETRQIYALKDRSTKPKVVISSQNNWLPFSIAVDDVTDKIYVAEALSSSLLAYDLTSDASVAVLSNNLTDAKDVEVDAHAGYLFVLDKYQILRTNMDGSEPTTLYLEFGNLQKELEGILGGSVNVEPLNYRKSLTISDIALDAKSQRVYWVNSAERSVESTNYEGDDRQVHFVDKSGAATRESLASLTVLGGTIYWADDASRNVFKIDANAAAEVILSDVTAPRHIRSVSCSNYRKVENACARANCEHLCLLSSASSGRYRCACPAGHELASGARSCEAVRDFVLFAQHNYLRGRSLASDGKADAIDPSAFDVGSGVAVDYDAATRKLYYSGSYPNEKLHEIELKARGETREIVPDVISRDAVLAAYDWATKNLYYFTYYYANAISLNVLNVEDPAYSKMVVDGVQRLVGGAVVHPYRGYVYFAQCVDDKWARISRLSTDGSGLEVLLQLGESLVVHGLALDFQEDRLYWSQSRNAVRHSNLDGEDVQEVVLPAGVENPSEIAIHGDYVYAFTGTGRNLVRFPKKPTGSDEVAVQKLVESEEPNTLSGLKIYSESLQTSEASSHPCHEHDCDKFCFAVPGVGELTKVCGCPYGEKLGEDGKTCADNSKEEPAFKECKYTSFKCNRWTE